MSHAKEGMQDFAHSVKQATAIATRMPAGSAEFVAQALAGARLGAWHLDIETGLTTWDAVASEIFGYDPAPRTSLGLGPVHPDDQASLQNEFAKCLRDGTEFNVQFRLVRTDGEIRWLHAAAGAPRTVDGPPSHIAGIVGDITARKIADEQLRQAEERHRLISRAGTNLIYEWDVASGELIWNEALASHFGHDPKDYSLVTELDRLIHPDDREDLSARVLQVLESGGISSTEPIVFNVATAAMRTWRRPSISSEISTGAQSGSSATSMTCRSAIRWTPPCGKAKR